MEVVEEDEADEVDEEEVSLESDSDFIASNKSCISLPSACPGSCEEPVELVEPIDAVEAADESELPEFELPFPEGGGPLGGGGIESPIWLSDCMTLCMSEPSPEPDPLPVSWTLEFESPLFD